jgi:hypothetical protein
MCVLACLVVAPLIGSATHAGPVEPGRFYFGIEIEGVLCGYSEVSLTPMVNRIKMVNLDDTLCAKVGVVITDVQAITLMKVRAILEPTGVWVTPEGLNVPGQRFTGTIRDNLIEGVFEIEDTRYDGADAPVFPADLSPDEVLRKYLEPETFIESDDPVLVLQALELTAGSKDSWEAACRLSRWVAQNIGYAIPGGGTARKTYDLRAGKCGAHAMLLAAFCRAVGIPARVVWGCMYASSYGGVFGQHGWNEIYMGPAGWIPVDATAEEIDFVDSGHLRIGIYESPVTALNPRQMQVLAYRVGTQQMVGSRTRPQTAAEPVPANARALPTGTW